MRAQMRGYNALIEQTFVDIPALEEPRVLRPGRSAGQPDSYVHISQNDKFSRRIFYRGDWNLGGRIHGGFWQKLPEEIRSQLFINDLPVVADDYRGTHVALLYGIEGSPLRDDPYHLHLPSEFSAIQMRSWVKSLILIAINASSEASAFNAFRQGQPTGSPAKTFSNAKLRAILESFKRQHPAIARYMCSDKGVELMAIDGRITARIIDKFTSEMIPVLTVFDSYIVAGKYAGELRSAMKIAMDAEVPGAATNYDRSGLAFDRARPAIDPVTGIRAMTPVGSPNVTRASGYLDRLHRFRNFNG